ncbi:MAG TPA: mechanosensitive ion channel domain-containing protein [Puia sp.]|nr:mechanosensitive ion channel domain-containing protein [Puia sp.]
MPVKYRLKAILFCLLFSLSYVLANAQVKKRVTHRPKVDTATLDLNSRMSDSILNEKEIKDTTVPNMVNKVETYSFSLNRAENFFDKRLDTTGMLKSLSGMERALNYFHNNLERNDNPLNLRNLNTASVLLGESRETMSDWQKKLDSYVDQLTGIHERIRTVKHDSSLLNDSLNQILHGEMKSVYERSLSLDSVYHSAAIKINTLRNRVSINFLLVKDLQTTIIDRQQAIGQAMWKQEESPLLAFCSTDYDVTVWDVIKDSIVRSLRVIKIFMATTWDTRTINIIIWILLLIWFLITLRVVRKKPDNESILRNLTFLKKSALLSSLLLLFTYGSFAYVSAPAAYVHLNEFIRLILLCILLSFYLTKPGKIILYCVAGIWVTFAIDDLLQDSAYGERWGLMIGGLLLLGLCIWMLMKKTIIFKNLEDSKARKWVLFITLIQISISIVCNLTGRVTLAKLFAFSAIDSLVLAVTLKICCSILVDAVYTQSEVFHNRFFAFLNFVDLKNKLRGVLWIVAIFVWILAILKNLTVYDRFSGIVMYFINKPRTIGSINFSYASGLLFVLIIWVSSVLSQFVNFFFDESRNPGPQKKTKLGSIALIVRISIWTAGFLIAVAAAGIPLDKISILIGALGVGIGFGLQNLVNNLVSGIIIAFERPIQIGDTIEISGKTGTVQEIGVRSSQITNGEGANIIVPNGDLLSQQLINWTMHNRNKRIKISLSVPYQSDFRKARDLVLEEINKNQKIMRDPIPAVTVDTFANNAVNFEVKFWVPDMSEVGPIRNELMLDIISSFARNNISIA